MTIYNKIQAAHAQLSTAITLFFNDGDDAAIHTLSCAAREIYERHCAQLGRDRFFDYIKQTYPDKSDKDIWDVLNDARNFLKHVGPNSKSDSSIEIDDVMNAYALAISCHDCAVLCGDEQPPDVQAFNVWMLATRFPSSARNDSNGITEGWARIIDNDFPGIQKASMGEQKIFGRELLKMANEIT